MFIKIYTDTAITLKGLVIKSVWSNKTIHAQYCTNFKRVERDLKDILIKLTMYFKYKERYYTYINREQLIEIEKILWRDDK